MLRTCTGSTNTASRIDDSFSLQERVPFRVVAEGACSATDCARWLSTWRLLASCSAAGSESTAQVREPSIVWRIITDEEIEEFGGGCSEGTQIKKLKNDGLLGGGCKDDKKK